MPTPACTADRLGLTVLLILVGQMTVLGNKTVGQKKVLESVIVKGVVVFAVTYTTMLGMSPERPALASAAISVAVAAAFVVLTQFLLNENSRFSIIPRRWMTDDDNDDNDEE